MYVNVCDDNLQQYIELIKKALVNIDEKYFRIKFEGIGKEKIRERVFCYELYHQIRKLLDDSGELDVSGGLLLNGEIDKSGNPKFKSENPDFVLHRPGTCNNVIVVEVKGNLNKRGIKKDIETLTKFVADHAYKKGIYIIYENSLDKIEKKIKQIELAQDIESKLGGVCRQIDVFVIEKPQGPVQIENIEVLIQN